MLYTTWKHKADAALTLLIIKLAGGRKWVVDFTLWLFDAEKGTAVPNEYEAGLTADPRMDIQTNGKFLASAGIRIDLTGSGVCRSYSVCTPGYFPRAKRPGMKLTTSLHLAPKFSIRLSILLLPLSTWGFGKGRIYFNVCIYLWEFS